ncbi:MAG TPA: pepsin-like aspartyl protease [Kofleriaceae bacterium]|jgi:hypothetical protein
MKRYSVFVTCFVAIVACGGNNGNNGDDDDGNADANNGSGSGSQMGSGSNVITGAPFVIPLLAPDGAVEFYAPMLTVGGVQFAMDLDTGSTTTAIAGSTCTDCSGSDFTLTPEYTPSSTAVDQHQTADTGYSDGTGWYGEVYQDSISLENSSPSASLNVVDISTQVDPEVMGSMAGFFEDNGYQGILGMGSPYNAEPNTGAYYQSLVQLGLPNVMAFEMCPTDGTMWLGGFDATRASAPMAYTPLDPITAYDENTGSGNPFYSVDLTGVSVDNKAITDSTGSDFALWVVDTGTSLFYPTTNVYNAALANVNASAGLKAVFGTKAKLSDSKCLKPTTTMTDAAIDQMLPPFVMTMKNAAGGADITVSAPALESYLYNNGDGTYCLAMGDGQDEPTMGDEIMQGFVVVIDQTNNQVGWAPDSGCGALPRPHDRTKRFLPPKPHHPRRVIHG